MEPNKAARLIINSVGDLYTLCKLSSYPLILFEIILGGEAEPHPPMQHTCDKPAVVLISILGPEDTEETKWKERAWVRIWTEYTNLNVPDV